MKISKLALVIVVVLSAASGTAEEFDIGSHGATLTLDDSWERRVADPDLGPDQFTSSRGFWCLVTEYEGLLDGPNDLARLVEVVVAGIGSAVEVLDEEPQTRLGETNGTGRATRRLTARVTGLRIAYQFDIVGRDGLAYLVMTWSIASRETDLHDWGSRAARGITMPASDSDWGRSAVPTPHSMRFGQQTVVIEYRDSLFEDTGQEDASDMRSLSTADDELAIHLTITVTEVTPDRHLDDVFSMVEEDSGFAEETDRFDLEIPAAKGRQSRVDFGDDPDQPIKLLLAAIPVAEDHILDLRMVVLASAWCEEREDLWRRVLDSIRVIGRRSVDAFPGPPKEEVEAAALNEAARALLAASDAIGWSRKWSTVYACLPDGGIVAHEGDRIVIPENGQTEEETLYQGSDWLPGRLLVWWNGELLTGGADDQVVVVRDGKLDETGISARQFAVIDDDRLVLAPSRKPPDVLGYEYLPAVEPSRLLIHNRNGEETALTTIDNAVINHLAVAPDRHAILVAARADNTLLTDPGPSKTELHTIDLGGGEAKRIATWQSVSSLAVADKGWLVSGTPTDGQIGLYLLSGDTDAELLISGEVQGLSLSAGTLRFATKLELTDEIDDAPISTVYECPIASAREHGPKCRPLTPTTINLIAAETAVDLGSPEGVQSLIQTADDASEEILGLALPRGTTAIDHLFSALSYDTELTAASIELLAGMIANSLLDGGAVWVPGPSVDGATSTWQSGWVGENLFEVAIHPTQLVVYTLFNEDGWWHPISSILESADGRTILIGTNTEALEKRLVEGISPESISVIEAGKAKKLKRLTAEHPNNTFLREKIYRRLAAAGDFAGLLALADANMRGANPALCDRRAWAVARIGLDIEADDQEGLIAGLRTSIGLHPEEPELYLLLGTAYERSNRPEKIELARACYLRTTDLQSWGRSGEDAQKALDRLDAEEETE